MRIRRYLLYACVGILAFLFGVVNSFEYQYVVARFRAPEQQQTGVAEIELMTVNTAEPASVYPEATPDAPEAAPEPNFDMSGEYDSAKKLPRGFKNFSWISVEMVDYETTTADFPAGVPIPPKGWIRFHKEYKFDRIAISGKTIGLETEAINGISYRFTGKFVTDTTVDGVPVDLHGHLTKLKNGRKVAETELSLYVGGC